MFWSLLHNSHLVRALFIAGKKKKKKKSASSSLTINKHTARKDEPSLHGAWTISPQSHFRWLLAARSGHGDFAQYHERFGHEDEKLKCPCGGRKTPHHFYYYRKGRKAFPHPWGYQQVDKILHSKSGIMVFLEWLQMSHFYYTIYQRKKPSITFTLRFSSQYRVSLGSRRAQNLVKWVSIKQYHHNVKCTFQNSLACCSSQFVWILQSLFLFF